VGAPAGHARDPGAVRLLSERCLVDPPVHHAGYLELLREMPFVMRKLDELPAEAREILCHHVRRSAEGMAQIVARCDDGGHLALATLQDLRDYCYIVAGIVGEMLTELFLLGRPQLAGVSEYLRQRAHLFGEGLQLVNILKDRDADAREGRVYVPSDTERAQVMALARADLRASSDYTLALQEQGAERGLVIFNALLVRLALGTLAAIRDQRPSGKLSRVEVYSIVSAVLRDVDNGHPVFPIAGSGADVPATA